MGVGAAAIIGGAAIGAGGSIFGSIFGANAQMKSMKYTADKAQETAYELDARQRRDLSPFRKYGIKAGDTLMNMLLNPDSGPDTLKSSGLFKFQQQQGERDISRLLAARGLQGSGAGLETLQRFTNQLQAEEGNRFYERLYNLTALGENAAARMASNTVQTGNQLIGAQTQLGVAQAGVQGQMYNQIGNTLQGIGRDVAQFPMYQASMRYMNSLSGGGGGGQTALQGMSPYGPYQSGYKFDLSLPGS
jgi:hypothetical protein